MFDCRKDLFAMYGCLSFVEGYSVKEVMETYEKVTSRKAVMESTDLHFGPRRALPSHRKNWNQSLKAHGNGISGKDYNDKAALVVGRRVYL
jgi:uncharacterized Fe-S center protein